ncbi:uncharacterized protein LOC131437813 [Malaya genurostris]|uniref:uncharacterized protein LOC131437813 n=1 Tax=Malaya genurostris TaxID=325434 RepID=UPI0026F38BCA|nr:uncharacterized protein LOC131437813 [Malaya genurostris]
MFRRLKISCENLSLVSGLLKKNCRNLLQLEVIEKSNQWLVKRCREMNSAISIPRPFSVRLAKAQDEPHIMHFLREHLYDEEPLLRSLNITKTMAIPCLEAYLNDHLKDGFTMIAVEPDNRIVGISLNQRNCDWEGDKLRERAERVQCDPLRKLFYIWSIVAKEPKLHQKYRTSCIFEIAILATAREAQRRGIGYQLTVQSLRLARDLGFDWARMDCTSEYSSRIAKKVGMDCTWSVPYKHLVDSAKKPVVIPDEPHSHIRVHVIQLRGS